jgi:hypothetical protein
MGKMANTIDHQGIISKVQKPAEVLVGPTVELFIFVKKF